MGEHSNEDWRIKSCTAIYIVCSLGDGRVSVHLNRLTGFHHRCRVRYNVVLGDGERRCDSGIIDDMSDTDGKGYGWHPRAKLNDLVLKVFIYFKRLSIPLIIYFLKHDSQSCNMVLIK